MHMHKNILEIFSKFARIFAELALGASPYYYGILPVHTTSTYYYIHVVVLYQRKRSGSVLNDKKEDRTALEISNDDPDDLRLYQDILLVAWLCISKAIYIAFTRVCSSRFCSKSRLAIMLSVSSSVGVITFAFMIGIAEYSRYFIVGVWKAYHERDYRMLWFP